MAVVTPASPRSPPSVRSDARAPSRGRDGTSSSRAEDSREDAPIGSWRSAPSSAPHRSVPLLTERSPTVGGAERDKSNKENTAGGRVGVRPRDAATSRPPPTTTTRRNRTRGGGKRVAAAASKQCLRAHALDVASPISFETLVTRVRDAPVTYLAAAARPPCARCWRLRYPSALGAKPTVRQGGLLVVGPEGDFTDEEVAALVEAGRDPSGSDHFGFGVGAAAVAIVSCVGTMHPGEPPPGC